MRPVGIQPEGTVVVTYFSHEFPAAAPAFSEGLNRVSKTMNVDTTYTIQAGQTITLDKKGLYLLQSDTSQRRGLAFRVEDDYPKFAKLETLVEPLQYICTPQEYEKLKAGRGDKKVFDKTVLSVTGNADRARDFMRSYFQHVEWGNYYFSSYKQGWMTDRGMAYILFGIPNQVYKFGDREVWSYKTNYYTLELTFVRSGSLFDPDNFVLVRDNKYQQTWYEVVNLWRKARF
ncbi:MAG: GWxTD domain-containing protein [Bacteroidia bacterium]|nr:GWxTD domain-containing protein [Bacteroidia bacterium]